MSVNAGGGSDDSSDNQFYDDIFSALKDMTAFLKDIKVAPLSERHVKERNRVEEIVHNLQLKIAEHVHEIQRVNGVKSPRPVRKKSPSFHFTDDRTQAHWPNFNFQLESSEKSEHLQPRLAAHRIYYSPEAKRKIEKPKIRPRSISCPEIRYSPHSWKTSLPKVPENEEFKEDYEKENKMKR